jgi:alkylated DNA nucleotide flippase Atl1
MVDQASKAQDLLVKEPDRARRIAMGEELAPPDILPESLFVAVENKAVKEGDVNTLRDLATSSGLTGEATTMGQRIRTLAERDPESPVTAIKEVSKARENKVKESKKLHKSEVANIKEHIRKVSPTKEDWDSFIRGIQC